MKKALLCVLRLRCRSPRCAAPENYTIDPNHTYAHFEVEHLGVSTHARAVRARRAASSPWTTRRSPARSNWPSRPRRSSTGDNVKGSRPRTLDEHLRTADFFNVAEFPRMTFKSTGVKFAGDNPAEIAGQLTLLGVTKPLTLKVERWVCKDNPMSKKPMCGGNASASLKRSGFRHEVRRPGDRRRGPAVGLGRGLQGLA